MTSESDEREAAASVIGDKGGGLALVPRDSGVTHRCLQAVEDTDSGQVPFMPVRDLGETEPFWSPARSSEVLTVDKQEVSSSP